jgi:prepilin-type N-terminal cleavage/methylation domain-containing protein
MDVHSSRGFSLIELAITLVIFGMLLAFTVPAFRGYSSSYQLKTAGENIVGQLRLAREKAIATGTTQTMRFKAGFQSSDYHVWDGASASPKWSLPRGTTYLWGVGTDSVYSMTRDGRCSTSGLIILQDSRGFRDTVSVQVSGLILAR